MSNDKVAKKSIKRVIKEEIETYLLLERMIHDLKKFENQLNEGVVTEGTWDTIKHWVSKLGSVTGGVKGLGKSEKPPATKPAREPKQLALPLQESDTFSRWKKMAGILKG